MVDFIYCATTGGLDEILRLNASQYSTDSFLIALHTLIFACYKWFAYLLDEKDTSREAAIEEITTAEIQCFG